MQQNCWNMLTDYIPIVCNSEYNYCFSVQSSSQQEILFFTCSLKIKEKYAKLYYEQGYILF